MSEQQATANKKDYDLEHMPKFIKDAPWYLAKDGQANQPEESVLFHQRIETDKSKKDSIHNWYQKGYRKAVAAVTKFRKGACENCGAMTHKTKECLERPRKVGAKWTQKNIARDEYDTSKQQVNLTYESKRDRWNGYNPDVYKEQVIDEWELKDQLAKEQKAKLKIEAKQKRTQERKEKGDDVYSSDSDDQSSDSKEETAVAPGTQNLRTREDTAKYLRNLDPNSAPYDPKSRSMKANPNPHLAQKDQDFKGDNFVKLSGDYINFVQNEAFMLDINKRAQATGSGPVTNMIGMPSQFEMLQKEFKKKKELISSEKMQRIQEMYGGQEEYQKMPMEIQEQLQDQYEVQQLEILDMELQKQRGMTKGKREITVRHDESQTAVVNRREEVESKNGLTGAVRSKYEPAFGAKISNGHSMVWGSFWHKTGGWGYKCCYSFNKDSKCSGPSSKVENLKRAEMKAREQNGKKRQRSESSSSEQNNKRQRKVNSESD